MAEDTDTKQAAFGATGGTGAVLAPAAKAPATKAPAPASGARTVEITDIVGQPAGFTVDLGPAEPVEGDENGLRTIANRIKGWSNFYVDGQPYEYSEANALSLVNRFGYIAEQLRNPE